MSFISENGDRSAASGITDREGEYVARQSGHRSGVVPGTYTVVFRSFAQWREGSAKGGPDWRRLSDPETSPYRITVSADNTAYDFDLSESIADDDG